MTSSTESKLKSKYQSSSRKIQELYEEFANMRKNIFTPSKKNKNDDSFIQSNDKGERDQIRNLNQLVVPRGPRSITYSKSEPLSTLNFQTQSFLKSAVLKNFTTFLMQLDKRMDQRVCLMQSRLVNLNQLFCQLSKLYKLKKQNLPSNQSKPTCKCSQFQKLLVEVENKYNSKIGQLVSNYQNKISLLVKQHQDTSTSSNSKNIQKQIKDQMQKLQDKLIVKQQQITGLKIQSSRLRRALDQHKQLLSEKESLVQQLSNQLQQKQSKITNLIKLKSQKISQDKSNIEMESQKIALEEMKKSVEALKIEKSQLQKAIEKLKKQGEQNKVQNFIKKSLTKSQWGQSQIEKQEVCVSDYEDEGEIVSKIKIDCVQDCQPLRHTQYFNSNSQKAQKNDRKIKQLQAQLQLLQQQNRFLKTKKDKFEEQCKDNQSDQQKFQMQCQILRDQLKNLNLSLKCLDDCAVLCLKQKKIPQENVEKLSDLLKFKQEFFKKYPKKKQKSVKA